MRVMQRLLVGHQHPSCNTCDIAELKVTREKETVTCDQLGCETKSVEVIALTFPGASDPDPATDSDSDSSLKASTHISNNCIFGTTRQATGLAD